MLFKNRLYFVLIFCLLGVPFSASYLHAAELSEAPINPLFLIPRQQIANDGFATGHRPGPMIPETHSIGSMFEKLGAAVTDAKYDMRDPDGDGNQDDSLVSSVKDQSTCGACWAFATYASLESYLIGSEDMEYDFSEDNLKHLHEYDWGPCAGGNSKISSAYLSRYAGPISEADDPYNPSETSEYCTTCTPVRYADNHIFLPARADSTDIDYLKQGLLDYGAMYISMYYGSSYYDSASHTYYYSGTSDSNHGVTLVGWDDNKVVPGAPGNGAFIIKNSWGSSWGENGYFYISYYDTAAAYGWNVAFTDDGENTVCFDRIYQYCPLGWISSLGFGDGEGWAANIFTPESNGELNAVGIYLNYSNTAYEIYIYDDFSGVSFSNLLSSETGSRSYAGWYTIPLTTPVKITKGDSFGIVVRFNNGGEYGYPLAYETKIAGYSSAASANAGESYYSSSGTYFTDLTTYYPTGNFCIKGFVAEAGYTYEDAEDGLITGWDIYDDDPSGATISNIYDGARDSQVIEFYGDRKSNGYRLRNGDGTFWNNTTHSVIEWSINYAEGFIIYIRLNTSEGLRYLRYKPLDSDPLEDGMYIEYGLGSEVTDGTWRTFIRDLAYDLSQAQSGNTLISVDGFYIRGSGRVDDIAMLDNLPAGLDTDGDGLYDIDEINGASGYFTSPYMADTDGDGFDDKAEVDADSDPTNPSSFPDAVYENAEDFETTGWDIYDDDPSGATISNVYDGARDSQVIEFYGDRKSNGYRLRNGDGTFWNNTTHSVIEWSMNYSEGFIIYIRLNTSEGLRYLRYKPLDSDPFEDGMYIEYGLGSEVADGTWHTFTRDLAYDLSQTLPGVTLISVEGFYIRGSGMVDDIALRN